MDVQPDSILNCSQAKTAEEVREAEALVAEVYGDKLGLSTRDGSADGWHPQRARWLVRNARGEPVGTGLWQSAAFGDGGGGCSGNGGGDDGAGSRLPLELEQSYDLQSLLSQLGLAWGQVAEVRRLAIRPGYRAALPLLLGHAIALSERCGVTHWLGLVEATGSQRSDVAIVQRVIEAHGLVVPGLPLRPHRELSLWREASGAVPRGRSAFSKRQLKKLPVPPKVRSFAAVLSARASSIPALHPHYDNRVTVPMAAEVAQFREHWQRAGGM